MREPHAEKGADSRRKSIALAMTARAGLFPCRARVSGKQQRCRTALPSLWSVTHPLLLEFFDDPVTWDRDAIEQRAGPRRWIAELGRMRGEIAFVLRSRALANQVEGLK